ncbi:protein JINGUBANG [Sesamum alatum]|uniref:Protein JINGUBANG n=1 Tax=Sesamum alatum TaxID=300844 RepID=A0AAE2CJ20_9LAMI|nr:protein JINGUBANG [Sesamum alatum]
MGRFLPCPLPCHCDKHQDSDQPHANLHSDSSSNSSLTSQSSLPSVPSLTPHFQALDHATSSAARYRCLATLKGHSSYVFSLALAGKNLYSGGSNGEIRVWDRNPSSLSQNYIVSEGYSAVKSIVVLGDKLFTAHHDHKIRVWRIANSTPHQKYKLITTLPTVNDRCMRLFSAKNYVQVRRHKKSTWVHHVDTVSALVLSRDGSLLYSVSWDRTLKVWRTSDFKCIESVQNAHDDAINAVVVSNDGVVYTGSADKTIKIWKKPDGEKKHSLVSTLEKHKSAVNALALSTDGSVLYSGACDRSIIVWEKDDGGGAHLTVAGALRGHKKAILCLAVVSDLLCSGSADKTVRIWRKGSGKSYSCLAVFEGHRSPVKCLTAALDNNQSCNNDSGNSYMIYSGSLDFDIKVWQIFVPF